MRLPENYIREMKELLGSEYPAYEASLSDPICSGLRINRLKLSRLDWNQICPFVLEPVPLDRKRILLWGGGQSFPTSLLLCRALLSAGAQRHDTGQPSSCFPGGAGAGSVCCSGRESNPNWERDLKEKVFSGLTYQQFPGKSAS